MPKKKKSILSRKHLLLTQLPVLTASFYFHLKPVMSPLCVWTDRRVAVGSRSRPVTRSLLSIFHGPVTLRVQTQAARSLWYTLKPEGVSIAHIKLLHSVIYRVSLWAPSVSLHYGRMRADSPASPPPHVQTCWIWCHECEFGSNNNKKNHPCGFIIFTNWPGAEIQRVQSSVKWR